MKFLRVFVSLWLRRSENNVGRERPVTDQTLLA
jgi:hypothetical protein